MSKCYVGRCKCGSIRAAVVAEAWWTPDPKEQANYQKIVADDVADFIKSGLTIDQMESDEFNKIGFQKCTCHKQGKQETLFNQQEIKA